MKEYRMSEPVLLKTLKKIYGSIGSISGKKVLVIRDFKTALLMAVRNSVVYVTDDPECAELFRKNTEAGMGNDDIVVLINKWTNKLKFTKVFEKMGMKFDVAIMNPPYDRNLHLKILEAVIPHAEKVVNISPVRWLQDPLAKYKKYSDYKKFEETVSKKIETLDIVTAKDATVLFGGESTAVFKIDLGIYTCSKSGGFDYKKTFTNDILDKIVASDACGIPVKKLSESNGNFCILNDILGNHSGIVGFGNYMPLIKSVNTYGKYYFNWRSEKNNLSVMENKASNKRSVNGIIDNWSVVELNSKTELLNFYNSTETLFFKYVFCASLTDAHVHPEFLPFMKDYTEPWDDKRFCEYFGITDDEWTRIEREMLEMNQ